MVSVRTGETIVVTKDNSIEVILCAAMRDYTANRDALQEKGYRWCTSLKAVAEKYLAGQREFKYYCQYKYAHSAEEIMDEDTIILPNGLGKRVRAYLASLAQA
jgi:hypothetical protein